MARTSYLTRCDGRYYVQARFSRHVAAFLGRHLYRASLRTADYRQARKRLAECMASVHRMNESIDYVSLFQKNAVELRAYLRDAWPVSEERLVARRNYEELLKNMARRAKAAGCDRARLFRALPALREAERRSGGLAAQGRQPAPLRAGLHRHADAARTRADAREFPAAWIMVGI